MLVVGIAVSWVWGIAIVRAFMPEQTPSAATTSTENQRVAPTPLFRTLDGLAVPAAEKVNPQTIGIMIENLPVVRPQSGLAGASIVYEALAEGGATRFLALYAGAGDNLAKIGPVRSARPYYTEWASEYDALYGHAGGSPDAIRMIEGFHIKDLNGIGREGKYFWRDRSIGAPHNLFTSSELLVRVLHDKELREGPTITAWSFKDDVPLDQRPADGQYVRIKFSGKAFETEYHYDRATNSYLRFNAGVVHAEALTGAQLSAKNVVVQMIPNILSVGEKGRLTLDVHGTGKAMLFIDGGVNIGTWTKVSRTARTQYFFENGSPAVFDRGATWVAVVPEDQPVEYGAP